MILKGREFTRTLSLREKVNAIESSAISHLLERFAVNKHRLLSEYHNVDTDNTGVIGLNEWCSITGQVLELSLPWRTLHKKLVKLNERGDVFYHSAFADAKIETSLRKLVERINLFFWMRKIISCLYLIFRMRTKTWPKLCIVTKTHLRVCFEQLTKIIQVKMIINDTIFAKLS